MHSDRSLFFCLNSFMVLLFHQKLKRVISILASFEPTSLLVCSAHLTTAMSCPMASERSTAFSGAGLLPPPSLPPSLLRCSARVPAVEGARTRGGGGLCSLLLSLLSDPSGSSDSLHSGSPPSHRVRSLSPPLSPRCLSVSLALLFGSLPLALLSGFFPQEPAEVPPGRRFCPNRPDCRNTRTAAHEPARSPVAAAWTRVPPLLLPPPLPPPPPRRGRPRPDTLSPAR